MATVGPASNSRPTAASAAPATTSTTIATRPDSKTAATKILPQRLPPDARKRTNSLGWAHSDCHTCEAGHFVCDRRRPRCDSCTARGVLCGGYVQVLNWQQGVASRGKMKGRQLKADATPKLSPGNDIVKPTAFLFIHEQGLGERIPTKRRKSSAQKKKTPMHSTTSTPLPERRRSIQKDMPPLHLPPPASEDSVSRTISTLGQQVKNNYGRQSPKLARYMGAPNQVPHNVGELLSFYHWQFARTTITCDVKVNPWQCSIPMVYQTHCLMNAITALSWRHRAHCLNDPEGDEVFVLKGRALALFSAGMRTIPCEALIATILALIGLEYAETGFSNWRIHLDGACKIIESMNGLELAMQSSTLRCQIAMLLWYDITSALLSRRGPIFPHRYLDRIVSWSRVFPGEWTYMSLNGCPDALLLGMYITAFNAPLAEQMSPEEVRKLESRVSGIDEERPESKDTPPSTPLSIIAETMSSSNPPYMSPYLYPSVSVEKQAIVPISPVHRGDESASLVKCWRLSMLLYIRQVFYRRDCPAGADSDDKKEEERRRALARMIISLVSNMPIESNWQKQCLLPIVIAGFELRPQSKCARMAVKGEAFQNEWSSADEAEEEGDSTPPLRDWVKSYCQRWKTLTGLWVFGTAGELLARIWARMDTAADAHLIPSSAYTNGQFTSDLQSLNIGFSNVRRRHPERIDPQSTWWGDLIAEDTTSSCGGEGYLFG